jgi:DNA-binding NarL/FixJ family response regulator
MTFSPPEVPKFAGWALNRQRMDVAQARRSKVLDLLREGKGRAEIAERLKIGKETVRDAIKTLRAQGCKWD